MRHVALLGLLGTLTILPSLAGAGAGAESNAQVGVLESSLDVITFNAWGLPRPIAGDRRERFPFINRFIREANVDLIGLQEVWHGALSLLDVDGLRLPGVRGVDSGLALVTPHPVEDVSFTPFVAERGFDAWKTKGILHAIVDFPRRTMRVLITHMQAGGGDKNARVRASQVSQIVELLAEDELPTIVLGDFNLHTENPIDRGSETRLERAGLVDAARSVGREEPTYLGSARRYDQVHLKDGGEAHLVATEANVIGYDDDPATANPPVLSDHLPLRVRLDIR